MKISNETLSVLKNFSTINQSIYINPGNIIKTISVQKTIMASAHVPTEFEVPFGIYDLSKFLSTISLFKEPDFDFKNKCVVISQNRTKVQYSYVEKDIIVTPPDKTLTLSNIDVEFVITNEQFVNTMQAASVLSLPHWCVVINDNNTLCIRVCDLKNPSSDTYEVEIEEKYRSMAEDIMYTFRTENLKFMPRTYNAKISNKGVSHFQTDDENLNYFITTESV